MDGRFRHTNDAMIMDGHDVICIIGFIMQMTLFRLGLMVIAVDTSNHSVINVNHLSENSVNILIRTVT